MNCKHLHCPAAFTAPRCMTLSLTILLALIGGNFAWSADMEAVRVSRDGRRFVLEQSGKTFRPWGFNYDHNEGGRLLEDYWEDEWKTIEDDFHEMKQLGANVVRIHLQFGRFMKSAEEPDTKSLKQLDRLLQLAERERIYLDLTGLGCYHKKDVPAWYDALSEKDRWQTQANFWEAIAKRCAGSPAVFCYDLMNEPVVPGGNKKRSDWLGPAFAGKHFVQFITLDRAGRDRPEVARQWIHQLKTAIRKQDRKHLVTVGLVPWSLDRPGLTSGFVPEKIIAELDFVSVHLYPEKGKVDDALKTLSKFNLGKPVVIEETFPLKCSTAEMKEFLKRSNKDATGWISFYWGKTVKEYRQSGTLRDAIMAEWLETFPRLVPRE